MYVFRAYVLYVCFSHVGKMKLIHKIKKLAHLFLSLFGFILYFLEESLYSIYHSVPLYEGLG